ncbi:MAG TPA: hypothetical protein VF886_06025 [Roseiarcus sp.]|jgi:hypothetical protein
MWVGLIFVCAASISTPSCDMANAYAIFRLGKEYQFQGKDECLDGLTKYFDAIEVSGDRNARFECSQFEEGK